MLLQTSAAQVLSFGFMSLVYGWDAQIPGSSSPGRLNLLWLLIFVDLQCRTFFISPFDSLIF
jgi:hypothetical protein